MSGLLKKLGLMVVGLLFISSICFAQGGVMITYGATVFNASHKMSGFIGETGGGGMFYSNSEPSYYVLAKRNLNTHLFVVLVASGNNVVQEFPVEFNLDGDNLWSGTTSNMIGYGALGYFVNYQDVPIGSHELEAIVDFPGGSVYETATLVVIDMDEENRSVPNTVAGNIYPIDLRFTDFDGKDICYVGVEWSAVPGMPSASNLYLDSACTVPMTGETTLTYTSKERLWGINDDDKPTTLYYKKPSSGMGTSYKVKLVCKKVGSSPSNIISRTVSFY